MAKQISRDYTVAQLMQFPVTRKIVMLHLKPLPVPLPVLENLHGSLRDMFETNMGGGIPYDIIVALMAELDALDVTKFD